jgi:hypothetical protein
LGTILQKLPLVEISSVEGDSKSLTIDMKYYYKPFPKVKYKADQPIPQVSSSDTALIQKLSSWQVPALNIENVDETQESSASATPLF